MLRVLLSITVMFYLLLILEPFSTAKENAPVQSTEGFSLQQQSIEKTVNSDKEYKKELQQKNKEKRIYFKTQNLIRKNDNKRTQRIHEIEYLEKRLELKKQKLETFSPNSEKGEQEE